VLLLLHYILYYINKKLSGSRILGNPETAGARRVSRWLYSDIKLTASPYTGVSLLKEVFLLTSEATVCRWNVRTVREPLHVALLSL